MTQVLFNGNWLNEEQATVSVFSESVQYGYGLFETLRTFANKSLPYLGYHLRRLRESATELNLDLTFTDNEIKAMIGQVVAANNSELQRIKLMLLPEGLVVYSVALVIDESIYNGVKLMPFKRQRSMPELKSTSYADCYQAWQNAQKQGAYDALFLTAHNRVLEASRANIFCLKDKNFYTPAKGILKGIGRQVICELQDNVIIDDLRYQDLLESDGVFLSNSIVGIVPVNTIGENKLAPLTKNPEYVKLTTNFESDMRRAIKTC